MKHIKNSIRGSISLLEHAGIPVALDSDFAEPIKDGSLCVDTTSQDLYILRNRVWVKMGSGFNQDDWIPRKGTDVNKPVYGDIEITDGIKFFSGQSGITFSDSKLVLGFSNNDLNISDNYSLILDRNFIIQKDSALLTIDSVSKNNFVNKINNTISPGTVFSNSSDNIINSNINFPTSFTVVNNSVFGGNIQNKADFGNMSNSTFHINSTPQVNFTNGYNNNINLVIEQTQTFSMLSNSYMNLRGKIYGNNSLYQGNSSSYVEGTFKNVSHKNSNFINFYGHLSDTIFTDNNYVYNLGHITGNEAGVLTGSASTSSKLLSSYQVYNLGVLGSVNLSNINNTLFLGRNTNIKASIVADNTLSNNNGYSLSNNSDKNILFNNENKMFTSTRRYSKMELSTYNILFNNNEIYSTSSNYNLIVNTDNVKLYGSNNLVFTPKEISSGFTGKIYGGNNVIFSLKPNKNYSIDSNVFTFGNINSTSGIHIKNGNILMGNVDINPSLSTNNQIFAAKRLKNINHSGQINNIFLNVDEFIVPDSNTVYLPQKFYGINLGKYGQFNLSNITGDQYWNFPDKSGTVALVSDITAIDELVDLKDVNINNTQNGDFLVYNNASTAWVNLHIPYLSGSNMMIDISYGDLYSLWSSSGLIVGAYYRFNYQTKHKIPYTTVVNTAPVEKLIAFAIAPNKLDKIVWSPSHPEDIIYYKIDDRVLNDSVEDIRLIDGDVGNPYIIPPATLDIAFSPTTNRTGRIYYREDTITRCSTPYDFRGVKFRRYKLKTPYTVVSTTKAYADGTVFNTGDITVVNNTIYMAKFLFTCSSSGGTLVSNTTFFHNITSFLSASLLNNSYVCPTPDTYVLVDNQDTPFSSLVLQVDNTTYFDFTTFDNMIQSSPSDNTYVKSYNCHIEAYIPAWLEQITWEYYPNIVFSNYSNNINIGIFSENITLTNCCNVDIDNYCKNMFVSTYNSYLNQTKIGSRCENVFIENAYIAGAPTSQTNYLYHTIGISNKNIINYKISNIEIGDKNLSLFVFATQECQLGSQNQQSGLFGLVGAEISQTSINDFNTGVCISHASYDNHIHNNNNNIILPTASHGNVIGSNNDYIDGIKTPVNSLEGVSVGGAFYDNTIGNNNAYITLAGFSNVVENNVEGVQCSEYVSFNNVVFKSGSGNLSITAGTNSVLSFQGTTFDYNRNFFGGLKTLTLNIQPIALNFLNFNQLDFSGNTLVAFRFVSYTNPTTYVNLAQRLYLT